MYNYNTQYGSPEGYNYQPKNNTLGKSLGSSVGSIAGMAAFGPLGASVGGALGGLTGDFIQKSVNAPKVAAMNSYFDNRKDWVASFFDGKKTLQDIQREQKEAMLARERYVRTFY